MKKLVVNVKVPLILFVNYRTFGDAPLKERKKNGFITYRIIALGIYRLARCTRNKYSKNAKCTLLLVQCSDAARMGTKYIIILLLFYTERP